VLGFLLGLWGQGYFHKQEKNLDPASFVPQLSQNLEVTFAATSPQLGQVGGTSMPRQHTAFRLLVHTKVWCSAGTELFFTTFWDIGPWFMAVMNRIVPASFCPILSLTALRRSYIGSK
jgi:hypothetical protein